MWRAEALPNNPNTDWFKGAQYGFDLDLGPNWNQAAGPIGSFAEAQVKQLQAIKAALAQ